jgi:hypothetical protein
MYITVKFFKDSGKLSHEETIVPGVPQPAVYDTDGIERRIEESLHPQMDYVWEAIETNLNQYNCRLVKK